jgi:hypothetical protein
MAWGIEQENTMHFFSIIMVKNYILHLFTMKIFYYLLDSYNIYLHVHLPVYTVRQNKPVLHLQVVSTYWHSSSVAC